MTPLFLKTIAGVALMLTAPCQHPGIAALYGDDVPALHEGVILNGRGKTVTQGCYYVADDHVFFTDTSGALWIPPLPVCMFEAAGCPEPAEPKILNDDFELDTLHDR